MKTEDINSIDGRLAVEFREDAIKRVRDKFIHRNDALCTIADWNLQEAAKSGNWEKCKEATVALLNMQTLFKDGLQNVEASKKFFDKHYPTEI